MTKKYVPLFGMSFLAILLCSLAFASTPDPQALLKQVDDNLWSTTKYIKGVMTVDNGRRTRVLKMETWMEGVERSYSRYHSPARERGTKMLKIGTKMWLYTPRTDRKILIAGHLLRQSMMGSDLSYEDMLEDKNLNRSYVASIEGWEEFSGVKCVILKLVAHDKSTTYQTRRLWIDPERKIVLKQEMFARSGKLLKKVEFRDYRKIGSRLFPKVMVFRDMLKENTQTFYEYEEIEFDLEIPEKYFSQRILKR